MDQLSERERQLQAELEALVRRRPVYPRAWKDDIEHRAARTGFDVLDVVYAFKEERGFVSPGPATIPALLENEKRFQALFEPDEWLTETATVSAVRSSAD